MVLVHSENRGDESRFLLQGESRGAGSSSTVGKSVMVRRFFPFIKNCPLASCSKDLNSSI